jgi:hypothetical protein
VTRRLATFMLAVSIACLAEPAAARGARVGGACVTDSVGVDTSLATESGELIMGMAWGETFVATDTLIQSVTVWRIPSEHDNPSELKFWITEVDSGGTPHTHLVVFDGPTLSFASPDSTRPTPITYMFDPPISLPRPSVYCFWVQEVCTGYADILVDLNDAFPGGHLWHTFRSDFDGCILRDFPESFAGYDLVFTLVFCSTHTTPVRNPTWGQLKARYR